MTMRHLHVVIVIDHLWLLRLLLLSWSFQALLLENIRNTERKVGLWQSFPVGKIEKLVARQMKWWMRVPTSHKHLFIYRMASTSQISILFYSTVLLSSAWSVLAHFPVFPHMWFRYVHFFNLKAVCILNWNSNDFKLC